MADWAIVFIAFIALLLALWEGYQNRRHNILSMKPNLYFEGHSVIDAPIGLFLVNGGVGPAIILSSRLCVDGVEVEDNTYEWRPSSTG